MKPGNRGKRGTGMEDCLFCKIIKGEIPSQKVYEDGDTYAFRDISPQAKTHVLVVCKEHVPDMAHADALTDEQLAACLRTCAKVAKLLHVEESGYRVVSNCGPDACQSVGHMHYHVLGGEKLSPRMV